MKALLIIFALLAVLAQASWAQTENLPESEIVYTLTSSRLIVGNSPKTVVTNPDGSITVTDPRVRIGLEGESFSISKSSSRGFCSLLGMKIRLKKLGRDRSKPRYMDTRIFLKNNGSLDDLVDSNTYIRLITCA